MKIAYCGYDFFHACLAALASAGHEICAVYSMDCSRRMESNEYVKRFSQNHGLDFSEQRLTVEDLRALQQQGCELLITAAYPYKIPPLDDFTIKGINVHPTLLPKGRGMWPLPFTILTQQSQTGVTVHKLSAEYDAGDVLAQTTIELQPYECLESLSAKLQMAATPLLSDVVNDFEYSWQHAKAQVGKPELWHQPSVQQRTLDWQQPVVQIERVCRAFGKYGSFARFDNANWLVYHLCAWQQDHAYQPGMVVHKTNTEMVVAAADGLVSLLYFSPG